MLAAVWEVNNKHRYNYATFVCCVIRLVLNVTRVNAQINYTLSTFDFNEFKTKEDIIKYSLGTEFWMCALSKNMSFIDNW